MNFLFDHYYVVSLIVVGLALVLFALRLEWRAPQAREVVVIAVMVAITVAGRAAFFMLPQCKPVVALVIIAGAALGAENGFAIGALSAFVSNFLFGQGPWTPWQMFALGVIGFVAGLLGTNDFRSRRRGIAVYAFGFFAAFVLYGLLLDVATVAIFTPEMSRNTLLSTCVAGIPFNLIHAVSTTIFLVLLARPMIEKLERVKTKYGLYGRHA